MMDKSDVPERAQKNCLYLLCYKICSHWFFTVVITLLIGANTVVLAMDKYPVDPGYESYSTTLNTIFTCAFVAEMVIKLLGLGFREYRRDYFNIFDAVVVVLSLVDMIVTSLTDEYDTPELSAFRGVRLLRVFKLARSWSSFRAILVQISVTLKAISTFSVLLLMFMFIFTLLGMELFGNKIRFLDDNPVDPESDEGLPLRPNFDNLGMGFTSIFAVAIGDDWNYYMAQTFRAEGFTAIFFYSFVFITMNLILFNLFLAILLHHFDLQKDESKNDEAQLQEEENDQDEIHAYGKIRERCSHRCHLICLGCQDRCPCFFLDGDGSEDEDEEDFDFESELPQD